MFGRRGFQGFISFYPQLPCLPVGRGPVPRELSNVRAYKARLRSVGRGPVPRELSNVRAYKARLRSVGRGPVPRERSSDSYANVR